MKATGFDLVYRPQPTIYLLCALGDEETRRVNEAAHERAIVRVLEWIEDEVPVIRYGKDGIYKVRPPGGRVAARFRHYEAPFGMPLLHDHAAVGEGATSGREVGIDPLGGRVGEHGREVVTESSALTALRQSRSPLQIAGCVARRARSLPPGADRENRSRSGPASVNAMREGTRW
ncbi:relaxase domain-containing protein [Streptomyces sp. NPDC006261]|uniref:relaxase domain-containing protein n=1 Tax=Streptomyces sp. NPDC006261 TaxID=3156739 RepID=UPI00339FA729